MRIRSLTLQNFRGFEDATVDLDRPLTVLFGVNGSGKSSVLQACAMALSRVLLESRKLEREPRAARVWHHFIDDGDVHSGARGLVIDAELSNGEERKRVRLAHPPAHLSSGVVDFGLVRLEGAAPTLPVFYDASRSVASAKDAFTPPHDADAPDAHPSSATQDALVAGHLQFRSFFQWFKAREDVENELKVSKQDLSLEDPQLAAVRRAVAAMLPGFSGLRIQRDPLHMVIRKGETPLLLDQLSDGEKLLLVLAADLARRLAITYAGPGDPLQGEAVVLIDEIEQHLHPDWQRRVLGALRRTFPGCQLIVTTHSPQVLSEVPNDAVVLVKDFRFFHPAAPTEGRDSNAILWEIFGVSPRPQQVAQEIEAIGDLLDDGALAEVRARLDRLAHAVTERDPDVTRLRGLLDVVERMDAGARQGG